ncbi:MAG: aminodeoxychorismate/anthranilate synthase component II, partial [Saprospirales bacterium]|nr:aminodeoxychorismate/anthranilate synthase component II [Saprospirales bacterium]
MTPRLQPNLLLIDNYDSFTYNLWDYFLRLGASCQVIRNDHIDLDRIKKEDYDGIVLSPGPEKPEDAGSLMDCVKAFHDTLPILGICLGHQAIGAFFGASLVKAGLPVHGKTSLITHHGHVLFAGLPPQFSAMRYHSLILEELPEN